MGFHRESAARFSFLISLPIVAGAAILKVGHLLKTGIPAGEGIPLVIGISTSAVFGFLSVAFLLKLVQRDSLYPFVWYRLVAGCGALALVFFTASDSLAGKLPFLRYHLALIFPGWMRLRAEDTSS